MNHIEAEALLVAGLAGAALWKSGALGQWMEERNPLPRFLTGKGSGMATSGDLRPLLTRHPKPGRLVMLQHGKKYLQLAEGHHATVFGGTTSGKTLRVLVPNLIFWAGPAFAISTQNNLIRRTYKERPDSRVISFGNPIDFVQNTGWSPLDGIREKIDAGNNDDAWRIALQRARNTLGALNMNDTQNEAFWKTTAATPLAAMLLAASLDPALNIGHVLSWAKLHNSDDPLRILTFAAHGYVPTQASEELLALGSATVTPEMKSSIFTTINSALSVYNYPEVLEGATRPDRFRPSWLLDPKGTRRTLYITASNEYQESVSPIINAIRQEVIDAQYELADKAQARLPTNSSKLPIPARRRLLLLQDEVANIAKMPTMPNVYSEGSGHGLTALFAFQDYSQLEADQGQHKARTVFNNSPAVMVLPGMKDLDTIGVWETLLGSREYEHTSSTTGSQGDTSHTTGVDHRPLIEKAGIRTLRAGRGILIYGLHAPIEDDLMPYGHGSSEPVGPPTSDDDNEPGPPPRYPGPRDPEPFGPTGDELKLASASWLRTRRRTDTPTHVEPADPPGPYRRL